MNIATAHFESASRVKASSISGSPQVGVASSVPEQKQARSAEAVSVLYIGGNGRSGSTLLGRILGEANGFVHVGELTTIWTQIPQSHLCGCGTRHRECDFWRDVFDEAFGGFDNVDIGSILKTKRSYETIKRIPKLLYGKEDPLNAQVSEYLEALGRLYSAIGKVSAAKVIVDGSKIPQYGLMLGRVQNVNLSVVHLVRDSRAVAFSWQRKKLNPALKADMKTYSPAKTAVKWYIQNMMMRLFEQRHGTYTRLRYEDLVKDPTQAILKLFSLIGVDQPDLGYLEPATIGIGTQHTASGNPDRFSKDIKIKIDREWQDKMPAAHRLLVTSLTLPLLKQYGYRIDGGAI